MKLLEMLSVISEKFHSGDLPVLENPSGPELMKFLQRTRKREARGWIDREGNVWVWDAFEGIHDQGVSYLKRKGLLGDEEDIWGYHGDQTGIRLAISTTPWAVEYGDPEPIGPLFFVFSKIPYPDAGTAKTLPLEQALQIRSEPFHRLVRSLERLLKQIERQNAVDDDKLLRQLDLPA